MNFARQYLRPVRAVVSTVLLSICMACSSGEDTLEPPPVGIPANSVPVITSSASISVDENTEGAFFAVTATDNDADPLSFTIAGGEDAEAFAVDEVSGALSFLTPPDFEAPTDTDGDNTYNISVSVFDDQGGVAQQALVITVEDVDDLQRFIDVVFSSVTIERDILFATIDQPSGPLELRMDVFEPEGDVLAERPVMLAFSGGGFFLQDRTSVEFIAQAFARRGYVAATVDYRVVAEGFTDPDALSIAAVEALHDLYAAVRFLRADPAADNTFGIDPDNIMVSGSSAGAVMSMMAATLDPDDTIPSQAVADYLDANGGVFGGVGGNTDMPSEIQGALPLSGAVLSIGFVDENSAPLYAAHEEFDPVVPCDTAAEGSSFTGLVVSGPCDVVPAYEAVGVPAELFLVLGSFDHVGFTQEELIAIGDAAAQFLFDNVLQTL